MVVRDTGGRRGRPLYIDTQPSDGRDLTFGGVLANTDVYFESELTEVLGLVIDNLVEDLEEPERSAVVMHSMMGLPLSEVADLLAPEVGRVVHRRQVKRWVDRGLASLRVSLAKTEWAHALVPGRIPSAGELPALRAYTRPQGNPCTAPRERVLNPTEEDNVFHEDEECRACGAGVGCPCGRYSDDEIERFGQEVAR